MFDELDELLDKLNSLLDRVLNGSTLDKMADVYAAMASKLETRGFSRDEVIQILSRQGGFNLNKS